MSPIVTTIIPAYNASSFLRRAVESFMRGGNDLGASAHEIIIVNDGSTDATHDIAEELALHDDRVWLIEQAHQGVSAARNAGIEVARGEWLHFLDADDWLLEGGMARLMDFSSRVCTGGACSGTTIVGLDGHCTSPSGPAHNPLPGLTGEIGIAELLQSSRFHIGASIIRRSALADLRFDPSLSFAEDWDLWLRLAERQVRWSVLAGGVSARCLRRSGLSCRYAEAAASAARVLDHAYERCRRHSATVVPAHALRRECFGEALKRSTLRFATAAALGDPLPDAAGSMAILLANWPPVCDQASPADLADAAYEMLPFADGRSPGSAWHGADGAAAERYVHAARVFWLALEREGLTPTGASNQAMIALRSAIADAAFGVAA